MTEEQKQELIGRLLSFISRKFLISLLIFIVSTVMVLKGSLSAEYWLGVIVADMLGYDLSNSASKKYKN
ncbi:MAG: hypothetical protein ACOCZ5_03245 [bacterium]